MQQPVKQGRCHHFVSQHLRPGVKPLVRRDDEQGLLVQLADQVEKQVRLPALDGCIPDLVNDHQVALQYPADPEAGGSLYLGGFQQLDQVGNPIEAHRISGLNRLGSKGNRYVRLSLMESFP